MISVGITGGIGSGKTTVCEFFKYLGVPVYNADTRAKALMKENQSLILAIKAEFGDDAYHNDGSVNRIFLSNIVFQNEDQLKKLNSLVHPAVFQDTAEWMQKNAQADYVLYEAAIMFESGSHKMLNKVITVYAPTSLRLQRVMQRDQSDEKAIRARMEKQMCEEEKVKLADYVIYNDGSQLIISQILMLHKELISLSSS